MKRTKKNYRKMVVYAAAFGLVTTLGYSLFRAQSEPTQVAVIDTPKTNCASNLTSFASNGACGARGFSQYSYSCQDNVVKTLPDVSCVDFAQAFAMASALCGETCQPTPSCVPNPCLDGRMCKLMALPEGQSYCPRPTIPPKCHKYFGRQFCRRNSPTINR